MPYPGTSSQCDSTPNGRPIANAQASLPAAIQELAEREQWVVWRYDERDGKRTKVLYNACFENRRAASTNPQTWTARAGALQRYEGGGFNGVGFVVTRDDPYVGVDLDHVGDTITDLDSLPPWARTIVDELDSYTEVTPSGCGVRIWLRGALPAGARHKLNNPPGAQNANASIEVYDNARFFTVTGRHLPGTPQDIRDRQEQLEALQTLMVERSRKAAPSVPARNAAAKRTGATLADTELLEKARNAKNGPTFRRLYETPPTDTEDKSAEDLALCNHLAFWTDRDAAQMDRLFRRSARMRDKWDERHSADGSTYGQMTISRAVQDCAESYSANRTCPPLGDPPPFSPPMADDGSEGIPTDGDGIASSIVEQLSGPDPADTWPYRVKDGTIVYVHLKESRKGDDPTIIESPVCDFSARITEEIVSDDGSRLFRVEGKTRIGDAFHLDISALQFTDERM